MSEGAKPTPQTGDPEGWFDDPAILGEERLLRVCKTLAQVSFDRRTNEFVLSDQVFSALGPGCSVELCSMYEADGHTAEQRHAEHGATAFGAVTVPVSKVRATRVTGNKDDPDEYLKVGFTPIAPGGKYAANPFHADIFPPTKGSSNKALSKAATLVIPVDQQKAAAAYALKTTLKP